MRISLKILVFHAMKYIFIHKLKKFRTRFKTNNEKRPYLRKQTDKMSGLVRKPRVSSNLGPKQSRPMPGAKQRQRMWEADKGYHDEPSLEISAWEN
jgi:hypothetical protein